MSSKKNDPKTIFIRYSPPASSLTRFHLENVCSEIGPVKKCSLIRKRNNTSNSNSSHQAAAGFAFVKFTSEEDAMEAVQKLNQKTIYIYENTGVLKDRAGHGTINIKLSVDLASDEGKEKDNRNGIDDSSRLRTSRKMTEHPNKENERDDTKDDEMLQKRKRTARVILRNLSFYATSNDVKKVMQKEFGTVIDINLPLTPGKKTHRGFAFVTFEHVQHAKKAVDKGTLLIKKREVAIDYSVSKMQHKKMLKEESMTDHAKEDDEEGYESGENNENEDADIESDEEEENDDDGEDEEEEEADEDEDESDTVKNETKIETEKDQKYDIGVHQHRTLFLRNLPYDCTRHDIFKLFAPYGRISSIYLVKDKNTGILKGTAFLEYQHSSFANAAFDASGCGADIINDKSASSKDLLLQSHSTGEGIHLQGRRIFVNYAVDRKTAASLAEDSEKKKIGKDKRNLYLKNEGRVGLEDGWDDDLLDSDKDKRGRAHNEKSQKLRSPLFFINPLRLSIRNLAKHIAEESQLRELIVEGLTKGLARNLVSKEDVWLHFRAKGDDIPRSKMLSMEIPEFEPKHLKQSIPSIYIDKDQLTSASKGFAFVEFTHHAHALACLRQLNNNPLYSKEYTAGGKKASQGNGERKVPRLIVEFTVENKAKAKQQSDRRARQLQNASVQKNSKSKKRHDDKNSTEEKSSKSKKTSRGALQRAKKRKLKAQKQNEDETITSSVIEEPKVVTSEKAKVKMSKPAKKHKIDKEEKAFESMVQKYKSKFMSNVLSNEKIQESRNNEKRKNDVKRRWFD